MKKFIIAILTVVLLQFGTIFADQTGKFLTQETFLTKYFDTYTSQKTIPNSYKYIKLNFKNIDKDTELYKLLQKAVYLNAIPNAEINIMKNKTISQKEVALLFKLNQKINIKASNKNATEERLELLLKKYITPKKIGPSITVISNTYNTQDAQQSIINDAYSILTKQYLDSNKIDKNQLEYEAIKGMTKIINDKHTIFFSPKEAKIFSEGLQGYYKGIGIYINNPELGIIIIDSVITNSPAEKAKLKKGDIIISIDGELVTKNMTIDEVVQRIKGPENTTVNLGILRNGIILNKTVERQEINTNTLETNIKNLPYGTCYMKINSFSLGINKNFGEKLKEFNQQNCQKYIFDVRNNPGGSLEEIGKILDFFVPTGKTSIIMKYKDKEKYIISTNTDIPKLTNKKINILINDKSASASEIFAGTIKDYCPNSKLIGEKTYGKNSVQNINNFKDGSILKYTVAKRLTGKSRTDAIKDGIYPDIKVIDNKNTTTDEQLEKAKKY